MTNPLGTEEQREALRATPPYEWEDIETQPYAYLLTALDGLDIADVVMRAYLVTSTLYEVTSIDERRLTGWAAEWWDAAEIAADEALRRWQAWRGERC